VGPTAGLHAVARLGNKIHRPMTLKCISRMTLSKTVEEVTVVGAKQQFQNGAINTI